MRKNKEIKEEEGIKKRIKRRRKEESRKQGNEERIGGKIKKIGTSEKPNKKKKG